MRTIAGMIAAMLLFGGAALAVHDPDELFQGTLTVIKTAKLAKFEGKPTSATPLPSASNAPTTTGGTLRIFDTGQVGNGDSYTLAPSGWSRIPKNEAKFLKGYKFKGQPCRSVIVKANVVKANCKGAAIQLDTPFTANVGIVLTLGPDSLGPDSKRYCGAFGGSGPNDDKKVKRKGASAPTACPSPLQPTTTTLRPTTTSTLLQVTTTSTSSTSSTSTPEGSTTSTSAPEGSTTSTSTPEGSTTSTSAPEGSTTSTSTPEGSTTSTSAPEGSTTSTSTPEGSTTSTSTPEGSTTSTSTPEGSTTSTSTPEGSTTSTSAPEGSTTSTSTPEGSTTSTSAPEGSTTSTSTPESSTTTTSVGEQCCNGQSFVSFSTVNQPGDCGDLRAAGGALVTNIECAGLYTGGGQNSVPLPFAVPDLGQAVSAITECTGQTAILGGTNSDETGSNKNCTSTGCLFGAPLAVPNPGSTPTSVCVTNFASAPLTGTAVCDTGVTNVVLPLSSNIFLTGDSLGAVDGIQPCPLCSGGTCIGGPNNGMGCTEGTTALNAAYPTSHDCPPVASLSIGTLPIAFSLTTGSLTWSGTVATNDTGSTASSQTRVFSGFCRDVALPDAMGAFKNPAQKCWENGMAVGAACTAADSFESCEQRNTGAFGPNGGGNRTITVTGSATSILGGPAPGTLVSIFSIPPTFDATIDGAGDLPGPGAVAIPGTAELCATANPCPGP